MNWIKLDKDNLPEGEIVAATVIGGRNYAFKMIGTLIYACGYISCGDGEGHVLHNVTHYLEIPEIDEGLAVNPRTSGRLLILKKRECK